MTDNLQIEFTEITTTNGMTYKCKSCPDTKVLKHYRVKHLNTKKHKKNSFSIFTKSETPKECEICYEDKVDLYNCPTCKHPFCGGCYDMILKTESVKHTCPFCRTQLVLKPKPVKKRRKKQRLLQSHTGLQSNLSQLEERRQNITLDINASQAIQNVRFEFQMRL
jgi:ribosomal protein L37AE/L43A